MYKFVAPLNKIATPPDTCVARTGPTDTLHEDAWIKQISEQIRPGVRTSSPTDGRFGRVLCNVLHSSPR